MPLEQTMKLVYIGPKPSKIDNVTHSAYVWAGYGDSQEVPADIGRKLMLFPTVWVTEQKFAEMQATEKAAKAKKESEEPQSEDSELEGESSEDAGDKVSSSLQAAASGADRMSAIKAAILSLEQGNDEHFSARTGAPLTDALKKVMSDDSLNFKEVMAAWNEMKTGAKK